MNSQRAGLAAYQQVAEDIKRDIVGGQRKPGDRLPGNRQLADDFGVSLGTAQKALQLLQHQGWLVATPAVGVFVATELPAGDELTLDSLRDELRQLREQTADLASRVEKLEQDAAEG